MEKKNPTFKTFVEKPIIVARHECIEQICNTLNGSTLPAFVKVEVLERILKELYPLVESEYQAALVQYNNRKED
jgi:hypothetical protein